MTYDYDLLIIGGGLVGGCLALALRDSPLRIAIIEAQTSSERHASPSGHRALALARGTVQILEGLEIWREVAHQSSPICHIHVSDGGHFGKTRLHAADHDVDALGHVLLAKDLEEAIDRHLRALPQELICPARLIGLKAGSDGICATIKQGHDCLNLTVGLVVAADGGNSTVRKLLGIEQQIRDYGQTAIITEVFTEKDTRHTAYERFTSSGPLALLPLGRKKCSVIWTLKNDDAADILNEADSQLITRLQTAFGYWLGQIELASQRQDFPLKLIQAEQMVDERVVLIGNAMHQLHPVAGQGFNLGLRDAILLADRLQTRLAFGEDIGSREFLELYARARLSDLNNVVRFTDGLVRLFSNEFPPLMWARNASMIALDCFPPIKQLLARYAMGYGTRL
jgi:2-octaprenyl-6-methoxyphenol hydroxylase